MLLYTDGNRQATLTAKEVMYCTFWIVRGVVKLPSQAYHQFVERRVYPNNISLDRWRTEVADFFGDEKRQARLSPNPVSAQIKKTESPMRIPVVRSMGRLVRWPSVRV